MERVRERENEQFTAVSLDVEVLTVVGLRTESILGFCRADVLLAELVGDGEAGARDE